MHAHILVPLVAFPLLLSQPAIAADADCAVWKTEPWEVEGGTALTAHICDTTSETEIPPTLYLQCSAPGLLALNYDDSVSGPPDGEVEYSAIYRFSVGAAHVDAALAFQQMDAVMTTELHADAPLIKLLRRDGAVTVSPTTGDGPAITFPLDGASQALAILQASCRKS